MTSQYMPGEIVDITIRARVEEVCHHGFDDGHELKFTYTAPSGIPFGNGVISDAPSVTVTRIAPADGMPKTNEVWQDGMGRRHLVVNDPYGNPELVGVDGRRYSVEYVHQTWPPLTPLIQDPDPEPQPKPSADEEVPW